MQQVADSVFGEVIYSYTRAQAIGDGVLVDVTETAREMGFRYPVAVTSRVWNEVITPSEDAKRHGQDENGRLWDVLWMTRYAILEDRRAQEIPVTLIVVDNPKVTRIVALKSVCGPGDRAEPVITIMMPTED